MNEIEEMQKIICGTCESVTGEDSFNSCDKICEYCKITSEALYNANYRKVKPVIIKINDKVEVHCDTMEDYDEFLKVEKQSVEEEKFQVYKNIWNANYQNMAGRKWKL